MRRKNMRALLYALLVCFALTACGAKGEDENKNADSRTVSFAAGTVERDAEELRLPLAEGETALLDGLPRLRAADFSGSGNEAEVAAWAGAHPEVECCYTVTLPDGTVLDSGTRSYNMSELSVEDCEKYAEKLALLPDLRSVRLGAEGGKHSWTTLKALREKLPDPVFKYGFKLYGKDCDLSDLSLNLRGIPVEDGGKALREVIPLMKELSYVDMDSCGVANADMEKLRADFPAIKFVWRVWFGNNYSVRTDVQRILASRPSAGGMLYNRDVEALSCCHDVVFLDLGHNQQLTDISFVERMPKLEVAILGMCGWSDAGPLAKCGELEYLEMFSTECSDLRPLSGLKNLKHLNIAGIVDIEDISPLYGLTQLERLWLGSMNRVPWEQVEEFQKRVPNCQVDALVYDDPTAGHWRWDSEGNLVDRYYLLRMQFGDYKDEIYSFTWNDPLYENK